MVRRSVLQCLCKVARWPAFVSNYLRDRPRALTASLASALLLLAIEPGDVRAGTFQSTVTQLSAGESHTCALTTAGGVKCWGYNRYGQLGSTTNSGTNQPNTTPLDVQTLGQGVVAVASGYFHTCALSSTGAVRCWGSNLYGQLGAAANAGINATNNVPVNVQTLGSGVLAISAGAFHTCALTIAGAVKCWGVNNSGQLGSETNAGSGVPNATPLDVATLGGGIVSVAAGNGHTCAVTVAGGIKCWGTNQFGQLGNPVNVGSALPNTVPIDVAGFGGVATAMTAYSNHSCAVSTTGGARCWGFNGSGQLGNPTNAGGSNPNHLPLDVQTLQSGVSRLAAGGSHSCSLMANGAAKCWGSNRLGELGSLVNAGNSNPNLVPLDVQAIGSSSASLTAGLGHTCAASRAGAARCWGSNRFGQLGSAANSGTFVANPTPVAVQTLGPPTQIGQSIAFAPPPTLASGASLTLAATATSGGAVSFDTWTSSVCSIDDGTLQLSSTAMPGTTCGVRASQHGHASGTDTYAAAPQQLRYIRIVRGDVLSARVTGDGSLTAIPAPAAGGITDCRDTSGLCTAVYSDGDAVDIALTATPDAGWHFGTWAGDCVADASDPLRASLTLDADRSCTASFVRNTYAVQSSVAPAHGGGVAVRDDVDLDAVAHGTALAFDVIPNAGWDIAVGDFAPAGSCPGIALTPEAGGSGTLDTAPIVAACDITVLFANQAPAFAAGENPTVTVESGPHAIAHWASSIRSGTGTTSNEDGQSTHFVITPIAGGGVLIDTPSIDGDGTLRFTPGDGAGQASYAVTLHDDAGSDHGGSDTSPTHTLVVTVAAQATDLSIAIEPEPAILYPGDITGFSLTLHNAGPFDATDAGVAWTPPADLVDVLWTCTCAPPATCTTGGTGAIAGDLHLPADAMLAYHVTGRIAPSSDAKVLPTSASVSAGAEQNDPFPGDNVVAWTIRIDGLFRDGMESNSKPHPVTSKTGGPERKLRAE